MNLLIIAMMVATFVLMATAPRSVQDLEQISEQQYSSQQVKVSQQAQQQKASKNSTKNSEA
ncbi:hypothetical protein A7P53_01365 [Acinetobacter defluvii]|uniref:hypothetical protein n=1 Tax=Acinetobacter defluvii TaxID=1871111 RepID=UPI00148FBF4B|nr:hypothetical protein [Acinetobacter defluvii]NNP74014.1 hypothetical protein [Acinetobacter defluvii]